ncbi:MAG: DUF3857 domain-containing protein [Myxococcota bacterium]|nr:DUF3857 domain-containing protein [Myxococcota bacterium]
MKKPAATVPGSVFCCATLCAAALAAAATAAGQEVGDGLSGVAGRARRAVLDAVAAPGDAAAVEALLRLRRARQFMAPAEFDALLSGLSRVRSPHPSFAGLLRFTEAGSTLRREGVAAAAPLFAAQGFVRDWIVVGPFDNEGRGGIGRAYPPEIEQADPRMPERSYQGKDREVGWLPAAASAWEVRLDRWIYPMVNTCSYAFTTLRANRPASARVWAGSDGAIAVWVGGREAIRSEEYLSSFPDRFAADVDLPRGRVGVLVKLCGDRGSLGFYLRLTDRSGRPLPTNADPLAFARGEPQAAPASAPARVDTAYDELARRAEDRGGVWPAIAARALHLSGGVDQTDNEAQKLLERHVRDHPDAEGFYWLAMAATDPIRSAQAATRFESLAGDDPFLLAAAANSRLSATGAAAADRLSRAALDAPGGAQDAFALQVRARVLQESGSPGACTSFLRPWLDGRPVAPAVLGQAASCLSAEGRTAEAQSINRRLAALNRTDPVAALGVLRDLALAGKADEFRAQAARLTTEFADRLGTLMDVADWLFRMSEGDEAVALLERLSNENPGHPSIPERLGRMLDAMCKRDESVPHFRRALDLQPQNQPLARYLEHIEQRQTVERRWAVPFDAIRGAAEEARAALDRTDAASRAELRRGRDVFRQEVDIIHPNGLSSRLVQAYTLVQTEEGAERFRTLYAPFVPDEESFELLRAVVHRRDGRTEDFETHYTTSQHWRGFYTDQAAEVIVFPRLAPGDVVELRYRTDGRSARNKFGEHFSREVPVATLSPADRFRYVLAAPSSKRLFVQPPAGIAIRAAETSEGGEIVRTYEAHSVEAIPEEANSPPMRELSRPILVSTFATWEDLGRWWWGLVAEQLRPDESIRRRTAEILAGADTVEEKVAGIYDWVIRNTRYVALEFGIHGWKPYRAHDVISRGFGDCKDKAALIHTMLAAAGIDSRLVLLRTRGYSGKAVSDFPYIAQFDHAIAYVPALDLYLDGTMTFAAMTELATMDREALALIVGPDGQERATTPLEPRTPDVAEARFVHAIARDGSSRVDGRSTSAGYYAHGARGRLEAAETRRKRVEEMFGRMYPGLALGDYSIRGLDDYREALEIVVSGDIPHLGVARSDSFSLLVAPPMRLSATYAPTARRQLDVELYAPIRERQRQEYRLPPGVRDIHAPRSREIVIGRWRFSMDVRVEEGTVEVDLAVDIPDPRIPVVEYERFRAFCAGVDAALAEPITYALP